MHQGSFQVLVFVVFCQAIASRRPSLLGFLSCFIVSWLNLERTVEPCFAKVRMLNLVTSAVSTVCSGFLEPKAFGGHVLVVLCCLHELHWHKKATFPACAE